MCIDQWMVSRMLSCRLARNVIDVKLSESYTLLTTRRNTKIFFVSFVCFAVCVRVLVAEACQISSFISITEESIQRTYATCTHTNSRTRTRALVRTSVCSNKSPACLVKSYRRGISFLTQNHLYYSNIHIIPDCASKWTEIMLLRFTCNVPLSPSHTLFPCECVCVCLRSYAIFIKLVYPMHVFSTCIILGPGNRIYKYF